VARAPSLRALIASVACSPSSERSPDAPAASKLRGPVALAASELRALGARAASLPAVDALIRSSLRTPPRTSFPSAAKNPIAISAAAATSAAP
jgi:hypothetical protein